MNEGNAQDHGDQTSEGEIECVQLSEETSSIRMSNSARYDITRVEECHCNLTGNIKSSLQTGCQPSPVAYIGRKHAVRLSDSFYANVLFN